jgi:hypothetical protein
VIPTVARIRMPERVRIDPADIDLPPTQPIDITAWLEQN